MPGCVGLLKGLARLVMVPTFPLVEARMVLPLAATQSHNPDLPTPGYARLHATTTFISRNVVLKSFRKSQFPHKSVELFCRLVKAKE